MRTGREMERGNDENGPKRRKTRRLDHRPGYVFFKFSSYILILKKYVLLHVQEVFGANYVNLCRL